MVGVGVRGPRASGSGVGASTHAAAPTVTTRTNPASQEDLRASIPVTSRLNATQVPRTIQRKPDARRSNSLAPAQPENLPKSTQVP